MDRNSRFWPIRINRNGVIPNLILAFYAFVVLAPIVNMVILSFKTYRGILSEPIGLPDKWLFANYATAWERGKIGQLLMNTGIVAVGATLVVLACGSAVAFAIARLDFRGSQVVYLVFLAGMALPVQMIAVPMFTMMRQLSLIGSLASLVIAYGASGMAFTVFLLVNFIRSIPRELDEAATIDGAGPFRIFFHIVLPLLRPALTTTGVFNFVGAWNGFFFPLIFIQDPHRLTVAIGVTSFVGQYGTEWNYLLPALVMVMMPTVLIFIIASKQFTRNMAAGAMKF